MIRMLLVISLPLLMAFKVEKDDFEFSGNKVTNTSFLIEVLENCDNNDRLNSDVDVKQCLFNTMLFSEVIMDKRGNKYQIDLKDHLQHYHYS